MSHLGMSHTRAHLNEPTDVERDWEGRGGPVGIRFEGKHCMKTCCPYGWVGSAQLWKEGVVFCTRVLGRQPRILLRSGGLGVIKRMVVRVSGFGAVLHVRWFWAS